MVPSGAMPASASSGVPSSVGLAWKRRMRWSRDCACSSRFSMMVACSATIEAASKPKRRASTVRSSTPASRPLTSRIGAAAHCMWHSTS
ncbi:hypothetical protein D3C85_356760 [compost metagenome]